MASRLKIFTMSLILFWGGFASSLKAEPVNRILLKIDDLVFSQRDLEIFFMLGAMLEIEGSRDYFPLQKSNWHPALVAFKESMLIYTEADKLRQIRLNETELKKDQLKVNHAIKSQEFASSLKRLQVEKAELDGALQKIQTIKNFKITYQSHASSKNKDFSLMKQWISGLEKKYFVRFFDQSDNYFPIP